MVTMGNPDKENKNRWFEGTTNLKNSIIEWMFMIQ